MKKGAVFFVTVAVLLGAIYFTLGLVIKDRFHKELSLVNQAANANVVVESYDKGIFTSDAKLNVSFHVPEKSVLDPQGNKSVLPARDLTFNVPVKIYHGPFIFAQGSSIFGVGYASTSLSVPEQLSKKMQEIFSAESKSPELELSLFLNYAMTSHIQLVVPPFELVTKDKNGTVNWMGLTNNIHISSSMDEIEGDAVVEGINITGPKGDAQIGSIETKYQVSKALDGLWVGRGEFNFPSMQVTKNGKKVMQLTNFSMESQSQVNDGLFGQSANVILEKLVVEGKNYGPGKFTMSISKLDAEALVAINKQMQAISEADEQQRQLMAFSLLAELPKLFASGAQFEITDLSMVLPEGTVDVSANVSVPAGKEQNPMMLIQKIKAGADLQAPISIVKQGLTDYIQLQLVQRHRLKQALAEQMKKQQAANPDGSEAPQPASGSDVSTSSPDLQQQASSMVETQLSKFINTGLLNVDGDTYKLSIEFLNGQLMVNGKSFKPDMLK